MQNFREPVFKIMRIAVCKIQTQDYYQVDGVQSQNFIEVGSDNCIFLLVRQRFVLRRFRVFIHAKIIASPQFADKLK